MTFIIRDLSEKPHKRVEMRNWDLVLLKEKEKKRKNGLQLGLLYPF